MPSGATRPLAVNNYYQRAERSKDETACNELTTHINAPSGAKRPLAMNLNSYQRTQRSKETARKGLHSA